MTHKKEHHFDYYSWFVGFFDGIIVGIVYEAVESEDPLSFNDMYNGFDTGYKDILWCCSFC